nr:hypothetical protein [Bacteroidales bacterium]
TISDIISESNQIKASADVSKVLYGLEYSYTNLDYIINPSSGLNLNLFGAFGKKKILKAQNIDSLFDNTAKTIQLKAGLNLKYYIPVYKNFVFLISTDLRFMSSLDNKLGNNLLFENELFRFGGAKSLRGFDEDAFFASFFVLNNLELRYRFERYSAFYIFVNGAYYNKHTINNNTSDYPFGFGLGVDIEMRTGIFSLAYALGKQFDNPFQIKSAKIHFGYITRF